MPASPTGGAVGALTRLVRDSLNQPGMSFRRFTEAAVDPETGYRPGTTWLHNLERGGVTRAPEPQVIRALAAGLNLPLTRVQQATAEQFLDYVGTELSGLPDDARLIVAHLADMDPAELPRALAVLEALIARKSQSSTDSDV